MEKQIRKRLDLKNLYDVTAKKCIIRRADACPRYGLSIDKKIDDSAPGKRSRVFQNSFSFELIVGNRSLGLFGGGDWLLFWDFEAEEIHEHVIRAHSFLNFLFPCSILNGLWCDGCFLAGEQAPDPVRAAHKQRGQYDEHE